LLGDVVDDTRLEFRSADSDLEPLSVVRDFPQIAKIVLDVGELLEKSISEDLGGSSVSRYDGGQGARGNTAVATVNLEVVTLAVADVEKTGRFSLCRKARGTVKGGPTPSSTALDDQLVYKLDTSTVWRLVRK
jgi:hypothetical protein